MKGTEKNLQGWSFILLSAFIILFSFSCKYELVKETTFDYNEKKNAADYDDFILPPEDISASQGQSKSVTLNWIPVKNAVQYYIYSAPSPYDNFVKISETRGAENEIVIDEEPGITKYYCVSAVNYYGTVSSKSIVVMGTSLAVPVITAIESSEEGDAVTVEWWMDNCLDSTYENLVEFALYTSLKTSPNIKYKTTQALGSDRIVKIDGLVSKTEYLFEVEVINSQTGQKESSGKYSAETAHRVLPDAPVDFTVSAGLSTSRIELKWKTPDGAWYRENSGASGFVKHPLYFEIYRKESGKTEYTKIKTINRRDTGSDFTWGAGTEALDDPYADYSIGAQISFTDIISEADRGKKFSYYVQSLTDDIPEGKRITSQSSCSQALEGWTVAVPSFSIRSNYTREGNSFTKIVFNYNLKFENYGLPYVYFVKTEKLPLGEGSDESQVAAYDSIESINSHTDIFTPLESPEQKGYYKYTLYLCPPGTDQNSYESGSFYSIQASGKYIVTDDTDSIPVIDRFSVDDGYADSYQLKWEYNSEYVYTVHWWEIHGKEKGSEESLEVEFNDENITIEDGITYYNFIHQGIPSGDRRIYQLEASTGISSFAKLINDQTEEEIIFESLGTAEPVFTSYDYNTIRVTWPKVQKVDTDTDGEYSVIASFEDGQTAITDDSNVTISTVENDENTYQCVIENPAGWNDATVSGKKINLAVTAKNGTKGNTTSQAIPVCTLGPALAGLKVAQTISEKDIILEWNKIEGAAAYKIIRQRFSDGDGTLAEPNGLDIYYVKGSRITINGEDVDGDHALIRDNQNGTFLFTDKAVDQIDTTNSYTVNQACIEWGLPFSYQILPIKEGSEDNNTAYINPQAKLGATKGYGLKVQAEKSKSSSLQVVSWEKTYNYKKNNPVIYYRAAGSTMNKWTKLSVEFENDSQTKPFAPPEKTAAYEYLVVYGRSAPELTRVPHSLLEDSSMGGLSTQESSSEYDYTNRLKEKANKGYLLAVNYSARPGSRYSEIVTWDEWDYSQRSIGPDSASISICNYNLGSGWTTIANLDGDLHCLGGAAGLENTSVAKQNDTEIVLEPVELMGETGQGKHNYNVTPGLLQVLRDAKHYYAITFEKNGNFYELGKDNDKKYAYRNISDKEFVKCALLTVAYGMYLDSGGSPDLSNVNSQLIHGGPDQAGYIKLSDNHMDGAYEFSYKGVMSAFSMPQLNPGNTRTSVMKVSFGNTRLLFKCNILFTKYYFLKFTSPFDLIVEESDSGFYSGTLRVTCNGTDELIVEKDGVKVLDINDNTLRRAYFPIQISSNTGSKDEKKFWLKDSAYGWWPEGN